MAVAVLISLGYLGYRVAGMISAVSVAAPHRRLSRWFAISGSVTAPLLAISGFAFPLNNDALLGLLELTLLLLLVWLGIFTAQVARRTSSARVREAVPVVAT
jgi:hypothetical protein